MPNQKLPIDNFTLNTAKNTWRKTDEFKSSPIYQNTLDKLREKFTEEEWKTAPISAIEERFTSIIQNEYLNTTNINWTELMVIQSFIEFIGYLKFKNGKDFDALSNTKAIIKKAQIKRKGGNNGN